MHAKVELTFNDEQQLYTYIAVRGTVAEKVALIQSLNLEPKLLTNTFHLSAYWGHLPTLQAFAQIPGINPNDCDHFAIKYAAIRGHLEVIQFLCMLPQVDPTAKEHIALKMAVEHKRQTIVDYLISLPCYNPFAPGINADKKQELITLFTELKLTKPLDVSRTRANLRFLFMEETESIIDTLPNDVKRNIAKITELKLADQFDACRTRTNLKFMFFEETGSILDTLPNQLKREIAKKAIEINDGSMMSSLK